MVTFMLFLGMANAYVMRTNMSVAIVAMVNQTALPRDSTEKDDECGSASPSWASELAPAWSNHSVSSHTHVHVQRL